MNCWLKMRRHRFERNGRDTLIDWGRNKMFGITCTRCGRDTVFFLLGHKPKHVLATPKESEQG